MDENRITYFAQTDARNRLVKFGIKAKDRTRHVYVIGKTGMGKSTMLENMAVQDIQNGEGMCFIDPHGKTADLLLEYVPKERVKDVIYIAPFDVEHPISFNVLESVDRDKRHLVSSGLMSTFKKIWEDAWSARMEYILTNTLLALLEYPGSTLLGVNRMLSDKEYRKEVVSNIQDPSVKAFWTKEFANYTERQAAEAVPAIQNKVGQFTANPLIRNMIGQPNSSFDFRKAMDERKIIIINLSKGRIGDENMKLLGGLLVTKIYLAAMSRADVPDRVMKVLPNFYLYVDEFQNFANASFADILSEARKYKLNLTIAHQYVEQMDEIVRPAVFGNVGTMVTFRVGATDAELLEKEFAPTFVIDDFVNLGFAQIYLKLMIDGLSSQPFSATTLPPIAHPDISLVDEIIEASRNQYSRPREEVEAQVVLFHNPVVSKPISNVVTDKQAPTTAPASINQAKPNVVPERINPTIKTIPHSKIVISPFKNIKKVDTLSTTPKIIKEEVNLGSSKLENASKVVSVPELEVHQNIKVEVPSNPKPITSTPASSLKSVDKSDMSIRTPAQKHFIEPQIKPISLSNLSHNKGQSPRVDPKIQTPKNVNDLRSALQAALQRGKDSVPQNNNIKTEPMIPNTGKTASVNNSIKLSPEPLIKPVKEIEIKNIESLNEVPEDVLKKVLKME